MKKLLLVIAALAGLVSVSQPAAAQSTCPDIYNNAVLTYGQWQDCFQRKNDALGYSPLNKAGDTATGRELFQSNLGGTTGGFNLVPAGSAPSAPVNGDIWTTSSGFYARINGVTVGPLTTPVMIAVKVTGLNLNTTADQAIAIALPTTNYRVQKIVMLNPSVNFGSGTAPLGGIYTNTGKSGFPLVAASQSYASLTTNAVNTAGSALDLTVVQTAQLNASTLYFALSTAHGATGTADMELYLLAEP